MQVMKKSIQKYQEQILAYGLVFPSLLVIAGVVILPFLYALWESLHQVNFLYSDQAFVGLANYAKLITDQSFLVSAGRTFYFTLVSIVLQVVFGLLIAYFLNLNFRGRTLLRVLILVPWAIPTVVNGTLWKWILDGSTGALNHLLMQFGLIERNINWLGQPILAIHSVILADTWRMLPLYVVMFLAGIQSIPDELYDAASVDGAAGWSRFWYVTLPYLRPVLLVVLILRTIQTLRVFDIIYIMTRGGPANGTMVMTFLTYFTTFKFQNFGYGSAMAFTLGLTTLLLAIFYLRVIREE